MLTRNPIHLGFLFAVLGLLLVGCVADEGAGAELDPRQSAIVGFVTALNTEGSTCLWVHADPSGEHPRLIGSVIRQVKGRWVGHEAVELGRGLSPKALRSVEALNRQLSDTPNLDQTAAISRAQLQDPYSGFLMAPNHLIALLPGDREPVNFLVTWRTLTKVGQETRVTSIPPDVLYFYHGRFQPDFSESSR